MSKTSLTQKPRKNQEFVLESRPEIKKGLNLVKKPENSPVFQKLVSDEISFRDKKAVWIDTGNESTTYALSSQKGENLLEKVEIARCFTPFQHFNMVSNLEDYCSGKTEILVIPNIDLLYSQGQINKAEALEIFQETWEKIIETTDKNDLKTLISLSSQCITEIRGKVLKDVENRVEASSTSEGVRYSSDEREQYFYRKTPGIVQTTIPLWKTSKNREKRIEVALNG